MSYIVWVEDLSGWRKSDELDDLKSVMDYLISDQGPAGRDFYVTEVVMWQIARMPEKPKVIYRDIEPKNSGIDID